MPRKSLGQHFLSDPRILDRIADALPAAAGDIVLEIGPGRGALTRSLLARHFRLTAIERDRELIPALTAEFPSLRLVEGDALEADWVAVTGAAEAERWWIIGNIPYNITSPLLDRALEAKPAPAGIVFLVQKEVAVRLGAGPGNSDYGALSVGVQSAATVERLFTVPAGAFWPPPRVDSAVVRLIPRVLSERPADPAGFRRFVVALFASRRKQLLRAMRTGFDLSADRAGALIAAAGFDPSERAETLSVGQFEALYRLLVDERRSNQLGL